MIIVKLNNSLMSTGEPKQHSIIRLDDRYFYLGNGMYESDYIEGLKKGLNYFIALEVIIEGEVLYVTENFQYISFDDQGNVLDKVKSTNNMLQPKYGHNIGEIILWNLLVSSDLDNPKGRLIAYKNYDGSFDFTVNSLPEHITQKTKVFSSNFLFEEKRGETVYQNVPLDMVVGTTHGSYEGLSWIDAFLNLKRMKNIIYSLTNPGYYKGLLSTRDDDKEISFIKVDDEYFIDSGNHRAIIAILKEVKSIYGPVSSYRTTQFHKNMFKILTSFGFRVELVGDMDSYYNIITNHNYEYEWEAFKVSYEHGDTFMQITLYNDQMIEDFHNAFLYMNTSEWSVKLAELTAKGKNILSLFANKYSGYDESWYEENVANAVSNFFVKNARVLAQLRNSI